MARLNTNIFVHNWKDWGSLRCRLNLYSEYYEICFLHQLTRTNFLTRVTLTMIKKNTLEGVLQYPSVLLLQVWFFFPFSSFPHIHLFFPPMA